MSTTFPFPLPFLLPLSQAGLIHLRARRDKDFAVHSAHQRLGGDDGPQRHDGQREDGGQHAEERAGKVFAQRGGRGRVHAQREGEAPPAHVEREACARAQLAHDAGEGEEEPDEAIAPDHEAGGVAEGVECRAGRGDGGGWVGEERVCLGECALGDFAELHEREAALAQRAERQEDGHDDLGWRQVVDGQPVEVHYQHNHGEREARAPDDVAGQDGPEGML